MSETVEELETDEDDEYLKMLTLIGRTEAIDTRVAIHEICHYLIDQFNVTDRIVQVSITPNDKWEGVCVGKRPKAFTKAIDASDVRAIVPMMPLAGRGSQLDRRCGAIRARYRHRTDGGRRWRTACARPSPPALDDRRQARELASLIAKSDASVNRFIAFCEQQAADMLAPHAMIIMSLQIILRMRRDISGEEIDRAAASVLGSIQLSAERAKRQQWAETVAHAARFSAAVA